MSIRNSARRTTAALFISSSLALSGCAAQTPGVAAPSPSGPVRTQPPPPHLRFEALDPTTSTSDQFAKDILSASVAGVASYIPTKPVRPQDGVDPVTGLDLTIRLVSTAPLAYGTPFTQIRIPSVAGLGPRPDMAAPGAMDPGGAYEVWKSAEKSWSQDYDAAAAAAQAGSKTVAAVNLSFKEWSGITGTMSALAAIAPADGDVSFAIASDLEETVPPQTTGSFHGKPLLVIQPNPTGDAATADAAFASFSSWATGQGVGQVTRIRPEVADAALRIWMGVK